MGSIKLVELLEQPTTKMNDELSTGWMNQPTNKAFRHVETLFVQGRNLVPWTNKVSAFQKAMSSRFFLDSGCIFKAVKILKLDDIHRL